jgi:multidrug resistance efflux pump
MTLRLPRSWRWRAAAMAGLIVVVAALVMRRSPAFDPATVGVVTRGALTAQITTQGTLRPVESLTYRSPAQGRELEIVSLAAEGSTVREGDLLVQLETSDLEREVEKLRQELRQLTLDLQVAHSERQEAESALQMAVDGEGALTVEEARNRHQLAGKKAARLREEYAQLQPLMEKGFITREELARTADELEQAEEELALASRRADVAVRLTQPREQQRATLQLAQKNSQVEHLVGRVQEAEVRLQQVMALVDDCRVVARHAGLVVYEDYLNASPRRKIRVGDRVGASQGLVTIPDVERMLVQTAVGEADVHRIAPGQRAVVRLEAFPDLRLDGTVVRVGTIATSAFDRPSDDKRFELVIELDPSSAALRPEMTARADIIVGMRADALLVPVTAVFERQGRFVAYVTTPRGVEAREIAIGESDGRVAEVITGLREADAVLLVDPGLVAPVTAPAGTPGAPARAAASSSVH